MSTKTQLVRLPHGVSRQPAEFVVTMHLDILGIDQNNLRLSQKALRLHGQIISVDRGHCTQVSVVRKFVENKVIIMP